MGGISLRLAIMKITENGDTLLTKKFQTDPNNRLYKIRAVSDGYLCFMTNVYTKVSELFKLNNSLEHEWSLFYPNSSFKNGIETKDNQYLFVEDLSVGLNKKTKIKRYNKEGDVVFEMIYDDIIGIPLIQELSDGNFIIGRKEFAKVDKFGNILWRKLLIPPEEDVFFFYNNIIETSDGGLLFTGRTKDFRIIVTKTDCQGNLTWDFDACPTYSTNELFQIYPNPIGENFTVAIPSSLKKGNYNFEMYDITGKKVKEVGFGDEISVPISTYALSNGMYIYSIRNENKIIQTGKLIKE